MRGAFVLTDQLSYLVVFEAVYVKKRHKCGSVAVRHSLSFLQAVPEDERGSRAAYISYGGKADLKADGRTFELSQTSLTPLKSAEPRLNIEDEGWARAGSAARRPTRSPVNPLKLQTAAVAVAGVLALAKLGGDANMFRVLRSLWSYYYDQTGVWCLECKVPENVVENGPEEVMKWNIALQRKEVILRWWHPFTAINLAYSTLVLLYIVT
jgi:hypothetical protein